MARRVVVLLVCVLYAVIAEDEGSSCVHQKLGKNGVCINVRNCKTAIEELKKRIIPQICSFAGADPVVCCIDNDVTTTSAKPPVATTSKRPVTPAPIDIPVYDYKDNSGNIVESCEALPPTLTAPKTGQKAWDKCIDYQLSLVHPCSKSVDLIGAVSRSNKCHHNADELIIGGENAAKDEFPHMVLLGFGDRLEDVQWQCGGTLVSDKFVLTAGHCTISRDFGPVTHAQMGALKRSEHWDSSRMRRIKNIIKHPEYKPPNRYHDIALLELESPVVLDQYLVPACLHVANDTSARDDRASATGWGLTEYKGDTADHLQKVILTKFPLDECKEKFPENRLMRQGFDEQTQMCFGDRKMSKDTCQGDSGGPLQIKSKSLDCMYVVIGVTSFGKACGFVGEPGIYTRVSRYVPWIESVVWPN